MAKGAWIKGFTLIELIVFIVVAGMFIPMAYIAFMAVTKGSTTPDILMTARFLTENKLEEFTSLPYDSITAPEETAYVQITITGYSDYEWKKIVTYVAYGPTNSDLTLMESIDWKSNYQYKMGDYIGSATNGFYICVPLDAAWPVSTPYNLNAYVRPNKPNDFRYKCGIRPLNSFPVWLPNRPYSLGDYAIPTTSNGRSYRCINEGISGGIEPSEPTNPWPTDPGGIVDDGSVRWVEDTNNPRTGRIEPSEPTNPWPTDPGGIVDDGSVRWVAERIMSGNMSPAFQGSTVDDNSVRWQLKNVYKKITIRVRGPRNVTYTATSLVSKRP